METPPTERQKSETNIIPIPSEFMHILDMAYTGFNSTNIKKISRKIGDFSVVGKFLDAQERPHLNVVFNVPDIIKGVFKPWVNFSRDNVTYKAIFDIETEYYGLTPITLIYNHKAKYLRIITERPSEIKEKNKLKEEKTLAKLVKEIVVTTTVEISHLRPPKMFFPIPACWMS